MRQIGYLDTDKDARVFCDFLYVQGVDSQAEQDGERWAIWVHSDDQIPKATQLLNEFRASPADPRFLEGSPAEKLREQKEKENEAYQKRFIPARNLFPGLRAYGFGPITYGLIFASAVIFIFSRKDGLFGDTDLLRLSRLLITGLIGEGESLHFLRGLPEIRHGEVWRLISPILIHFGLAHILFNMMWLRDLGSMFEARLGSLYFVLFIVVVAAASNFGQYVFHPSPAFGGMSGVVYGLIGYVWMRGRFDPGAGLFLDKQSIVLALIWFVACFTGLLGPIANGAHAVGLILGVAWGFVDAKRR